MRKYFLPVFIFCLTFLIMEFLAFIWVNKNGNALDKTRGIVVPHAVLGWKHERNLATEFLDKDFTTDEYGFRISPASNGKKKILFLGPSSTVGWGVSDNESYPSLMSGDFQVKNAAQIGYSTFQGLKLFETELSREKFDYVVIAFGINDVDLNRFYFQSPLSDAQELESPKSSQGVAIQKILYSSSLIAVVNRLTQSFVGKEKSPDIRMFVRVKENEFRENLLTLVRKIKAQGATPIFLSTATHFQVSSIPEITLKQNLVQERLKNYLMVLSEVARTEQVDLADPSAWLIGNKDEFFVDPVHFSVKGNSLIAEGLRNMIKRKVSE